MSQYFDNLETRDPEEREQDLFARFPYHLEKAIAAVPGLAHHLYDFDPMEVDSREALTKLPVLRKPELMAAQAKLPPFGGFVHPDALSGNRVFMSPGPIWEPQGIGADPWGSARCLYAAGFRRGDIVHNALSYHMTPGAFVLETGAIAMGCITFPAGTGNTEMQIEAIAALRPSAFVSTPDYLKVIMEKAREMGVDITSITKAMVGGGALFPALRAEYQAGGVQVMQCYATADLGVIAYESELDGKVCDGMVANENMIVEIVRPGTSDPVEPGEVGEITVTTFNDAYPLVRFGTGDLSAILPDISPCGRTNMRIKGWMGRADQRTKVKGMFVDPKQVDAVVKAVPEVERARLTVNRENSQDVMTLSVVAQKGAKIDIDHLEAVFSKHTKLRSKAVTVADLPNDGMIIDDQRDYEGA